MARKIAFSSLFSRVRVLLASSSLTSQPVPAPSGIQGTWNQYTIWKNTEPSISHLLSYQLQQYRGAARDAALRRLARVKQRSQSPVTGRRSTPVVEVNPRDTSASTTEIAHFVGHSALVVTRPVEWGTVLLGYEQANRYQIFDERGELVALLAEEEGSLGRFIGRQILRTRRAFTATVFSPSGEQVIFRLRRPAYLISSTIYIEDGENRRIGEVQQRWHPWRRRYDLFLGKKQFAAVDGGFLAWEFQLTDEHGGTLALIDRNFSGFGKELFTDAGKYVIHFGENAWESAKHLRTAIQAAYPDRQAPPVTSLATVRTDGHLIPTSTGNQLAVSRSLALEERMIALAAAISVDYDYFSRHSHGHGVMGPFMPVPMIPFPMPGGGGGGGGAEGEAPDAEASSVPAPGSQESELGNEPLERDLGGDEWVGDRPPTEHPAIEDDFDWRRGHGDSDGGDEGDGGEGGFGLGDVMDVFGWDRDE